MDLEDQYRTLILGPAEAKSFQQRWKIIVIGIDALDQREESDSRPGWESQDHDASQDYF